MFSPHYNCDIKSVNHIYSNAETGNFSSPELADYFIGDNLFVVLSECSNTLSVESKKTSCIRFLYKVYSKSENYSYTIKNVSFILDGKRHNINEFQIMYYPYESEKYIRFEKSRNIPDYYNSYYHLGYITFPTPKDKKLNIEVTVSDNNSEIHTFNYLFNIKIYYELFYMLD